MDKLASPYSVAVIVVVVSLLIILTTPYLWREVRVGMPTEAPGGVSRSVEELYIAVVVDNSNDPGGRCYSAWGISLYVRYSGSSILFDAGPDPGVLLRNAEALGIDLAKIDAIVISHEHGDHIDGLEAIALINRSTSIYIPMNMSSYAKNWIKGLGFERVIEVANTTYIAPGIAVVGQLYGPPYEEALVIDVPGHGLVLLVGCSHPGVRNIAKKAIHDLREKIYAAIGGFHLAGYPETEIREIFNELKNMNASIVIPIHCSGDTARELAKRMFSFDEDREGHMCSRITLPKQ